MHQRVVIIVVFVVVIFIGGVWFATLLPNNQDSPSTTPINSYSKTPLFTDVRLGTPVRASFATQKNPPIKQKTDYTINELIMLQATTSQAATSAVTVSLRLIDSANKIIALSPGTITLNPGTNSYCCWTIPTPGKYIVQVLRPDSITTALPITITRDLSTLDKAK